MSKLHELQLKRNAAEEMYEALKAIEAFGEDEGNDDAGMMATEMYNIACAALAKAEGKQP